MTLKEVLKWLHAKRAVNAVVSNVILVGAVIAVSFVVLFWTQHRASAYNEEYSEAMNADIAKLKERLAFEYVFYDEDEDSLKVYLMNCGTINGTTVETVYVTNDTGEPQVFSTITLMHFNGEEISDQDLDRDEEGYFVLSSLDDLVAGTSYSVRVVTGRGSTFDRTFIP